MRWPSGWRAIGLGLAAGALFSGAAQAQRPDTTRARPDTAVVPISPRPDTLPADSTRRDTVRVARDSVQPPLATAPVPPMSGSLEPYVWDREAIFSSGALTLLDLVERVPGVTGFRAGWLLSPEQASYLGAFGRVRVFYDNVELDPLDVRTGGPLDLATIELWTLEQVAVERGAGELRLHLRSWRVRRTTPDTRTDVATGEPNTNQFRGFFGRRFGNGAAVQAGFQQFSTGESNVGGDGDQLGLMARVGWASTRWSIDGFATRTRRVRTDIEPFEEGFAPVRGVEDARMLAYLRAGYRDPLQEGLWAQVLAASDSYDETSEHVAPADTADTTRSRVQYVASAGWNVGALRLEGTARLRAGEGEQWFSPAARAALARGWWAADAYVERRADDSTQRLDAAVRLTPLSFLWASVAASRTSSTGDDDRPEQTSVRGEVGLRLRRAWLIGGMMMRDGGPTGAPIVFDPELVGVDPGRVTGIYGGLRGPIWQDLSADVLVTLWEQAEPGLFYQPEFEGRAELRLDTRWLRRFPSGEFGLKAALRADYRDDVHFPRAQELPVLTTLGNPVFSALLEIRIQDATVFFQGRNIMSQQYELLPQIRMPRQLLLYGVRWQFWN